MKINNIKVNNVYVEENALVLQYLLMFNQQQMQSKQK